MLPMWIAYGPQPFCSASTYRKFDILIIMILIKAPDVKVKMLKLPKLLVFWGFFGFFDSEKPFLLEPIDVY